MKHQVVAYLAKEGITIEELIDDSSNPLLFQIEQEYLTAILYLQRSRTAPKWLELFTSIPISDDIKLQDSLRGVLIVETNERLLAFTFGHGRSLINLQTIVRGFGLRVAMNLGDPKQLKSIDKSTLDKVALNTRSQASKNTGIEDFDFEFDHEILKSLTAVVDNEDTLEIISGNDAVALYTEIQFNTIQEIADRLLEAYELQVFRQTYPWFEYIEPERDRSVIDILDELVIIELNNNRLNNFWLAPPEIIDYMNFSGFVYRQSSAPVFYQELNLDTFLTDSRFRRNITLSSFKNKKIFVYDASEEAINKWSAFRCLNGEVSHNQTRYILNDGQWYKVKPSFYVEVCSYFNSIDISNLPFPNYQGQLEGPYLRSIANGVDFGLLDQQWVRPNGVSNNLEFCDLLSSCNGIIHVKKYGSSAVLNHLFAQAFQSIEMLINSPEVLIQVNQHLANTSLSLNFNPSASPREQRIILAIMDHSPGSLDIPFFAKVNLRHYVRKIKSMGFNVEMAKIRN